MVGESETREAPARAHVSSQPPTGGEGFFLSCPHDRLAQALATVSWVWHNNYDARNEPWGEDEMWLRSEAIEMVKDGTDARSRR